MKLKEKRTEYLIEDLDDKKSQLKEYVDMLRRFPKDSKLGFWSLSMYVKKLKKEIVDIELELQSRDDYVEYVIDQMSGDKK